MFAGRLLLLLLWLFGICVDVVVAIVVDGLGVFLFILGRHYDWISLGVAIW